jgi:hypothetical protein
LALIVVDATELDCIPTTEVSRIRNEKLAPCPAVEFSSIGCVNKLRTDGVPQFAWISDEPRSRLRVEFAKATKDPKDHATSIS